MFDKMKKSAVRFWNLVFLTVVLDLCQDQRLCVVHAASKNFDETDPCPTTSKYLKVAYKCRPNEFRSRTSCAGDTMGLRCQGSKRIALYSAMFGRTRAGSPRCRHAVVTASAESGFPTDCQARCSLEVMMKRCHGRRRCHVPVSEDVFGRACTPSTRNYLHVVYACVQRRILKEMKDGDSYPVKFCDVRTTSTTSPPSVSVRHWPDVNVRPRDPLTPLTTPVSWLDSTPAVLYSSTVNSSGVVVGVAVSEDGVGFIKDWVRTWHYLEKNEERLILYVVLGLCVGTILFLLAVIVRLCQRRGRRRGGRDTGRRVKLEISEPMRSEVAENQSLLADRYTPRSETTATGGTVTTVTTLCRPTPQQRAGFSYPRSRLSTGGGGGSGGGGSPAVELHAVELAPRTESTSTLTRGDDTTGGRTDGQADRRLGSRQHSEEYLPPYTLFEGAMTLPRGAGEDGGTLTRDRQSPRIDLNPRRPVGQSPLYVRRNASGGARAGQTLPPQPPGVVGVSQPRTLPARNPGSVRWAANGRESPGPCREPSSSPTPPTPIMKGGVRRSEPPSPQPMRQLQRGDSIESDSPFPRVTSNGSLQRGRTVAVGSRARSSTGPSPGPYSPGSGFHIPPTPDGSFPGRQNHVFPQPRAPGGFPRPLGSVNGTLPRPQTPSLSSFQSPQTATSGAFQRPAGAEGQRGATSPSWGDPGLPSPLSPGYGRQDSAGSLTPNHRAAAPPDSMTLPPQSTFSPLSPGGATSPASNSGLSLPPPHMVGSPHMVGAHTLQPSYR